VPIGSLLEALGFEAAERNHAALHCPKQAVNQTVDKRLDWTMPSASLDTVHARQVWFAPAGVRIRQWPARPASRGLAVADRDAAWPAG
jgi:hypothetical protein